MFNLEDITYYYYYVCLPYGMTGCDALMQWCLAQYPYTEPESPPSFNPHLRRFDGRRTS